MRTQHLRDTRLSLKAIGLFSIILSLPPEWDFSIAGLAAITKDGIATVRAALNELEANGYLTRKRVRREGGWQAGTQRIHLLRNSSSGKACAGKT